MRSRVLGHLVLEAPSERGQDWVCKRILNCPDEQALALLAQRFIFTFIGTCASPLHIWPRCQLFFLFSSFFVNIMKKIKVKASAGRSLLGGRGSSTLSTPGGVAGAGAGGLGG
jgi:hypothetical protein